MVCRQHGNYPETGLGLEADFWPGRQQSRHNRVTRISLSYFLTLLGKGGKMKHPNHAQFGGIALIFMAVFADQAAADKCSDLANLALPEVTSIEAISVA